MNFPVTRSLGGLVSDSFKQKATTLTLALGTMGTSAALGYSQVLGSCDLLSKGGSPQEAFFLGVALTGVALTAFSAAHPQYSREIRSAPFEVFEATKKAIRSTRNLLISK